MAPTQQSASTTENNSETITQSTSDFAKSVHKIKEESYRSNSSSRTRSSSSSSSSSSIYSNSDTANRRLCDTTQETLLPISSKGHFFHDAFFEDARQDFEAAVRNVLDQRGHGLRVKDDLTSYRMLRKVDLSESSQAAIVTENRSCHQVVMDVRDFMDGDVRVKVVDEDEVVVEGSVGQRSGGSVSQKSFRRSFTFPGLVKAADVTSTMSSDGVLTIMVPKKDHVAQMTNINIQESSRKTDRSAEPTETSAESAHETSSSTHSQSASPAASRETTCPDSVKKDSGKLHQTSGEAKATTETACKKSVSADILLPISHGGCFFEDSFFAQAHQEFKEAMKKVLHAAGESPKADVMTSYRNLRERHLKDDNQAVSLTEDSHQHKVVMDMRDFMTGDVKVKVVNEDEVVVEGSVEQKSRGSVSKNSFRRNFTFPGLVKAADITSTMSSDGVLTIMVPKKDNVTQIRNIDIQESSRKTDRSAETDTSAESACQASTKTHSQSASSVASVMKEAGKFHQASDEARVTTETACKDSVSESGFAAQLADLVLPIAHGGRFFEDSFFAQAHQEFEEAMKKVLHTAGESPKADVMTSYRSLRERQLNDENQAVSLTEDSHQHKVVIDMRDFVDGDMKVKVVNEDEVVVEGSVEQKTGGSVSRKNFRRSFTFPGLVKATDITSTLSSDGVLTISVPKKEPPSDICVIVNKTEATESGSSNSTSSIKNSSKTEKESSSRTSVHDEAGVHGEKQVSSRPAAGDKQICPDSHDSVKADHGCLAATKDSSWALDSLLPVFPKGPFFHDSFFEESRQHFEAAVKEALGRLGQEKCPVDDLSLYRSLRSKNLSEDSQAVKVTEDEHLHQVVLDVHDFLEGDIKVKVVGNSEVQVEGRLEKEDGGFTTSRSFRRRFHLPGVVNVNAVTSALSSDGVLTIKAPKGNAAADKRGY